MALKFMGSIAIWSRGNIKKKKRFFLIRDQLLSIRSLGVKLKIIISGETVSLSTLFIVFSLWRPDEQETQPQKSRTTLPISPPTRWISEWTWVAEVFVPIVQVAHDRDSWGQVDKARERNRNRRGAGQREPGRI